MYFQLNKFQENNYKLNKTYMFISKVIVCFTVKDDHLKWRASCKLNMYFEVTSIFYTG